MEFRLSRLIGIALLCAAGAAAVAAGTPGEVPLGGTLRDAELRGLNGPSRHLSAYRGKPLIINVWASWCGPCKEEMASLERLAWREQGADFAIIGISTDDDANQARKLLQYKNATISQYLDRDLEMENMLGASRLPLTVLIDAKGRVLQKIYGAQQWDSPPALRLIEAAFRQPAAALPR